MRPWDLSAALSVDQRHKHHVVRLIKQVYVNKRSAKSTKVNDEMRDNDQVKLGMS